MGFFSFFTKVKVNQVGATLAEKLANYDPDAVSQAGLMEMERELDVMLKETADARQEYQREQQEATVARNNLNSLIAAARKLGDELKTLQEGTERHTAVSTSLTNCLDKIDKNKPLVEREEHEAGMAKQTLDELDALSVECATRLKEVKQEFEEARRELKTAKAQEARAAKQAERAAVVAGIRQTGSHTSTALQSIQRAADEARARAEAQQAKASLLQKPTETVDPVLQAALDSVNDVVPTPTNPLDRLANL